MFPDASPPARGHHEGSGAGGAGAGAGAGGGGAGHGGVHVPASSSRPRVLSAIRAAVCASLAEPVVAGGKSTLESTVSLVQGVQARLVASHCVAEVEVDDDDLQHSPVYMLCAEKSTDWRYLAVLYRMDGPWLPRYKSSPSVRACGRLPVCLCVVCVVRARCRCCATTTPFRVLNLSFPSLQSNAGVQRTNVVKCCGSLPGWSACSTLASLLCSSRGRTGCRRTQQVASGLEVVRT
jgi:hypothetical protein